MSNLVHQDSAVTAYLNQIASQPYKFDYFSVLRQLEAVYGHRTLLGKASSPKSEPIRITQEATLSFAPRNIHALRITHSHVEISIHGFGLFGPSGPLPLHMTEYAYERKHQYGDHSWIGFANMLQHRLALLFYRAWANGQSIHSVDKNAQDTFGTFISSLNSLSFRQKYGPTTQIIHEYATRSFAGFISTQSKSADNLQHILEHYFHAPVYISTNIGRWVKVAEHEQSSLGNSNFSLGDGLLLGNKLYDIKSKFRITIGPLNLKEYQSFFKKSYNTERLHEWVLLLLGQEFQWDIQPVLSQSEVPKFGLKGKNQLGLSTWLGRVNRNTSDLIVSVN